MKNRNFHKKLPLTIIILVLVSDEYFLEHKRTDCCSQQGAKTSYANVCEAEGALIQV